jgi:hypothetical protein
MDPVANRGRAIAQAEGHLNLLQLARGLPRALPGRPVPTEQLMRRRLYNCHVGLCTGASLNLGGMLVSFYPMSSCW